MTRAANKLVTPSRVVPAIARAGLVAEGALYVVIGLLAIDVAQGQRRGNAGSDGAIEAVARQPYGRWLLGVLTVGFFAMAAWRALQALQGDPVEGDRPSDRAKFGLATVANVGLGFAALGTLLANLDGGTSGGATGAGAGTPKQATAVVLDWPAGRWLVALAGVAAIVLGVSSAWSNGVHEQFTHRLRRSAMSRTTWRTVVALGRVGFAARGVTLVIIGVFLLQAAATYDASEAKGLSGSLRTLAQDDWGRLLLWAIALGFFCYGAYHLAAARYRRVTTPH